MLIYKIEYHTIKHFWVFQLLAMEGVRKLIPLGVGQKRMQGIHNFYKEFRGFVTAKQQDRHLKCSYLLTPNRCP